MINKIVYVYMSMWTYVFEYFCVLWCILSGLLWNCLKRAQTRNNEYVMKIFLLTIKCDAVNWFLNFVFRDSKNVLCCVHRI